MLAFTFSLACEMSCHVGLGRERGSVQGLGSDHVGLSRENDL